jgi:hypothetical protein
MMRVKGRITTRASRSCLSQAAVAHDHFSMDNPEVGTQPAMVNDILIQDLTCYDVRSP